MYDLLVVGAGPYGLSIASHAAAAGLRLRVFGRPMASWRDHMPRGMFLKSEPWASNLSDPDGRLRLEVYCAGQGVTARHGEPIPVEMFAEYGLWFAHHAVPVIDERTVTRVAPCPGGFEAVTEDGQVLYGRAVALAVGVMPFVEIPSALRGLDPGLVSHSSHHSDLDRFRGKDVTVIGGGQAALETAALLAEQGTRVRVLARADRLVWNDVPPPWKRPWWQSARSPHSGLGPGWRNWFYSERPGLFRRLPEPTRARIAATALGPAGAWWVRDRVEPAVEVLLAHEVTAARAVPGGVRLELTSRAETSRSRVRLLETEHVVAATGFTASCDRLDLLSPDLLATLGTVADGSPEVGRDFESTYPGLFMAGLLTAAGYGPAMRFVHGATYTAGALVRGVRRHLRSAPRGSLIGRQASGGLTAGTAPVPMRGGTS
ncbi:NAD(P)-binding domain-containing protein [Streptomyces cylindrosporus]|uniref:NAD(P)-binding domain-containing protein n=1 Tax=Streptomyces cylindrosporus TaxID=2927583 RepID=A0ABS9XX19_9ACTN|nr:NAD(P)-binding domain-containing protein [Streptomyces cylindrosporus]MCI3269509.1 NAD(P)-binding domain-containing protein [Streptomyces cylindrosporus]